MFLHNLIIHYVNGQINVTSISSLCCIWHQLYLLRVFAYFIPCFYVSTPLLSLVFVCSSYHSTPNIFIACVYFVNKFNSLYFSLCIFIILFPNTTNKYCAMPYFFLSQIDLIFVQVPF